MRAYLIAHGIATAAQLMVILIVVTVGDRKLARECEQALRQWNAREHHSAGSVEETMEAVPTRWRGPSQSNDPPNQKLRNSLQIARPSAARQ